MILVFMIVNTYHLTLLEEQIKRYFYLTTGIHVKGIKPKGIRPHVIKHRPNILYGVIRKQPPLIQLPIKRKVVAKVVEPRYDVVYPYGLGGEYNKN